MGRADTRADVHGFHQIDEVLWELPPQARADMRVPARVFADRDLIAQIAGDRSLEQLQNVATLPGIEGAALAMPDIHQGYGFPVGGVAATEPPDGVVSPGGVGYDISCGVRLLALPITGAWLALLNTQLRAAEKHAAAAELQLRLGRPASSEMERRRVAAKRVTFRTTLERHPEWVAGPPAWPAALSLDPGAPVE